MYTQLNPLRGKQCTEPTYLVYVSDEEGRDGIAVVGFVELSLAQRVDENEAHVGADLP